MRQSERDEEGVGVDVKNNNRTKKKKEKLQEQTNIIISNIPFKACACEQSDHRQPEETRAEKRGEGRKPVMRGVKTVGQEEVKL